MHRSLMALGVVAALAAACGDPAEQEPDPLRFDTVVEPYAPGALFSVWGSDADDVWVVGGELGSPVVLHFDGTAWTRNDPPVSAQLWWVHGFADGPVYVAGEAGALARLDPVSGWEIFDAGYGGTTFYGIWGSAPDDMWAVGGPYASAPAELQVGDVVLHFDGTQWERVRLPELDAKPASAQKDLFKVWGASADRVFIVGASGMALHFDGATWTKQDTGLGNETLFTVWGRTANDVYAVGGLGRAALIHWNGSRWSEIDLPRLAPPVLQGLWTEPGAPVYVGGHYGFLAAYDAGAWRVADPTTDLAFHGLWGAGATVWAGGGNILTFSPDYDGVLAVCGRDGVPAP